MLPSMPRCKELVFHPGGPWGGSPCTRKPVRDGLCNQHHPDTVKARREAADAKSRIKWNQREAARRSGSLRECSDEQLLAEVMRRGMIGFRKDD